MAFSVNQASSGICRVRLGGFSNHINVITLKAGGINRLLNPCVSKK